MDRAYYAVIPANVRYDKGLPDKAKLLYGEITALCNKDGFCWATNGYFAELYGVTKVQISRLIKALSDRGYIKLIMKPKNDHTREVVRTISLADAPLTIKPKGIDKKANTPLTISITPHNKNVNTPITKMLSPHNKNVKENNTSNNTVNITSNITNTSGKPDKYATLAKEVIGYLNEKLGTKYKPSSAKTMALIKARVNEEFTLDDFKQVIDKKVVAWLGDERMEKYLRPETLFGSKFESYLNEVDNHGQGYSAFGRRNKNKVDPEWEREKWKHETSGWGD